MGRRLFDIVDAPDGWNDKMGYGAGLAAEPPVLVVTRTPPDKVRLADRVTFVVDGIASAVAKGIAVADDRDVVVMGGGETVRRAIEAGLVDELRLHLAPVLLGDGVPLFAGAAPRALRQIHVRASGHATHLTYRVD
jgi:dihydrofolate reductase